MKYKAFQRACEHCGVGLPDTGYAHRFEAPDVECPSCESTTHNRPAYIYYSIVRAAYGSLIIAFLPALAGAILICLRLLPDASTVYLPGASIIVFLVAFGILFHKKRLAILIVGSIHPVLSEISRWVFGIIMTGVLFLFIRIALDMVGIKTFDIWLLAALSLVCGFYGIAGIGSANLLITYTSYKKTALAMMLFWMAAPISFAIVFIVVTVLAWFNLYTANSFLDILAALSAAVAIASRAFFLKEKQPSVKSTI